MTTILKLSPVVMVFPPQPNDSMILVSWPAWSGPSTWDPDAGKTLTGAWYLWQGLQGLLALTIGRELTADRLGEISGALREDLVKIGAAADFLALELKIKTTADSVLGVIRDLIEDPAGPERRKAGT